MSQPEPTMYQDLSRFSGIGRAGKVGRPLLARRDHHALSAVGGLAGHEVASEAVEMIARKYLAIQAEHTTTLHLHMEELDQAIACMSRIREAFSKLLQRQAGGAA